MYSAGRSLVVERGTQSLQLDCDFHSEVFNLFDNPVQWHKTQLNESTPINLMGNLLTPFIDGRRLQVTLTRTPPRYNLRLNVYGTNSLNIRALNRFRTRKVCLSQVMD